MFRKYFFSAPLYFFLILSITATNVAGQSTDTESALPAAARELLNKGIAAAKIPDYLVAAGYFEDARKIAPQSSEIFFNLGLAESKIPGRELRAISWFSAYLLANANSPNAAAIKDLIVELNKKNKANILLVLDMLEEILKQSSTWENIAQVAELRIKIGDINGAKRVINGYDVKGGSRGLETKNAVLLEIIQSQIAARDTLGARISLAAAVKTADLLTHAEKVRALANLALLQMNMKDSANSRNTFINTINFIKSNWKDLTGYGASSLTIMLEVVARQQVKAGDIQGAENTLTILLKSVALFEKAEDKKSAQIKIKDIYVEQGYFAKAREIIESIEHWDYDWEKQFYISWLQIVISKKRKTEGDIVGALKAAELIQSDYDKSGAQREIAEFQFNSGDITGARSTLAMARATVDLMDDQNKSIPLSLIARLQAKIGDINDAKATLKYARKLANKIPKKKNPGPFDGDGWRDRNDAQGTVANVNQIIIDLTNGNQIPNKIITPPIARLNPLDLLRELNDAPFLNLPGYLKSLNENDPARFFTKVYKTVEQIITAEGRVEQMLKEQSIVKK